MIASIGVCVGMWLERFLIIVPSLGHKYPAVQLELLSPAAERDSHYGGDVRRDDAALHAVREVRADYLDLGNEGRRASGAGTVPHKPSPSIASEEMHA